MRIILANQTILQMKQKLIIIK